LPIPLSQPPFRNAQCLQNDSEGIFPSPTAQNSTKPILPSTSAIDMTITALRGPLRCLSTRRDSNTSQYRGSMATSRCASADRAVVGRFCFPRPWLSSLQVPLRACSQGSSAFVGPPGTPLAIAGDDDSDPTQIMTQQEGERDGRAPHRV
jgi:hypothetical protein